MAQYLRAPLSEQLVHDRDAENQRPVGDLRKCFIANSSLPANMETEQ